MPIATTITAAAPATPPMAPPVAPEQALVAAEVPPAPQVAAAPPQSVTGRALLTGVAVVVLGWVASAWLNRWADPQALKIPAGISIFALFYVVTQGLERLLEPFARFWDGTREATKARDDASVEAERHKAASEAAALEVARHKAASDETAMRKALATVKEHQGAMKTALEAVAHWQAVVDQRRANRTVILWAVASVLGMLLSGVLGLYLLHAVGLQDDLVGITGRLAGRWSSAPGVRHALDLLVTGLAIGGGTKPLHDLIQNLQEAKNDKKDPAHVLP